MFEKDRSDKPTWIRRSERTYRHGLEQRKRQLRTLMSVDDMVRALFRRLSESGELANTLAFFISDNGDMWAEHGWTFKIVPYTSSIEVPLFMRWPARGIRGSRDRRLVTNVDLAPTILDAAGVAPDPRFPMDGRSMLDAGWRRRRLLTEHWRSLREVPTWASIRKRGFQYVEYYGGAGGVILREYYNLRRDPWQLRNLLHDGRRGNNPSRRFLRHLHDRLRNDRRCEGATGSGHCP